MLLAVICLTFLYVALKAFRAPEWVAIGVAVVVTVAVKPYLPQIAPAYAGGALVAFFLLPYWLAPVVVWRTQTFSTTP